MIQLQKSNIEKRKAKISTRPKNKASYYHKSIIELSKPPILGLLVASITILSLLRVDRVQYCNTKIQRRQSYGCNSKA